MKRPYCIKNQRGNFIVKHYDTILNAYFKEKSSIKIDDTYIDIKGATVEQDRTVVEVYVHGI